MLTGMAYSTTSWITDKRLTSFVLCLCYSLVVVYQLQYKRGAEVLRSSRRHLLVLVALPTIDSQRQTGSCSNTGDGVLPMVTLL